MSNNTIYQLNDQFLFDPKLRCLQDTRVDGETTWLGSNEANLLLTFILNFNRIVTKTQLHNAVWLEHGLHVDDSSVIQSISLLRKYLRDSAKKPKFIKTVSKKGYLFIADAKIMDTKAFTEHNHNIEQPISKTSSGILNRSTLERHKARLQSGIYLLVGLATLLCFIAISTNLRSNEFTSLTTIEGVNIQVPIEHKLTVSENKKIVSCLRELFAAQPPTDTDRVIVNLDPSKSITISIIPQQASLSRTLSFVSTSRTPNLPCQIDYN
jgi:DNA-binding winged helix-turn-helix (wHTH) protein